MLWRKKIKPVGVCLGALLSCVFSLNLAFGNSQDVPDWVKRIEFSAEVQTEKKPTFSFQTVQPLYQDEDKINTIFVQPRAALHEDRTSYNLGFGYRRLVSDNLILGINTFGDYEDKRRHGRVGIGVEALGQVLEARMNSYFGGISSKSNDLETGAGTVIERVVDGYDAEFGTALPYMPWLKVYGSGFWYDFKEFDDKYGWKSRLEARMNDYLRFELYTWDDNKGDTEYGGRVRFNMAFGSVFDIKDAFQFSEEKFPEKDLKEDLLIPVERNHEIIVERYTESAGLTIEAGRSG